MESSEDDAGTATSASRCASAREKDVGQIEDVESTSNYQQESSEARASCGTPSMSEDNFDGDSVPSPSAQDVNTSTEAILDMIDEFVDGPGAPKRIPCADDYTPSDPVPPAEDTHKSVSQEQDTQNAEQAQQPLPSANSEPENIATESENKINNSECTSESEQPTESLSQSDVNSECAPLDTAPQISVIGENAPVDPINESESNHSEVAAETETLSVLSASSLPSSSVQTDQSEPSDCERTVKIVTSSDNRDNVTVEKAESTSSECSVSESKPPVVEQLTRSPLRRRLVRPAPNDRRPDSTVSSTVDTTQTVDIDTPQQETCESVTKDVSSSSDAVPIHHGNTKPEEISNVSEISVCKAETTTIPSKKIKLIRPKIIPVLSNRISETKSLTPEKDPCQSTSSEDQSIPNEVPPPTVVPKIETNDLSKQDNVEEKSEVESNKPTVENLTPETVEVSPETSSSVTVNSENTEVNVPEITEVKVTVKDQDEELPEQSTSDSSSIVQEVPILEKQNEDSSSNVTENVEEKKVPPIKLSLSKSHQELQDTENQSSKNVEAPVKEIVDTQTSENVNCGQEPVLIQNAETEPIVEERKVPPFKLNLSSSDTKSPDLPSPQKSSNTEEDLETKLVPKLTIKLGNKSSEEPKSPKLSIKPLRPPVDESPEKNANQIASITKINIKPIVKPTEKVNDVQETDSLEKNTLSDQIPNVTKLNIKPIPRPPEKINDIHRKSSSSEISESEYSENDDTSTSDQASTSDQGSSETVPKVTIKLGRPGTESEGKFYTEQQNIPKLTIKNIQQGDKEEQDSKLKLIISQSEDKFSEKVPKLTIKTVATKSEGQPLSPKLTIKPIKPPDGVNKESEIPKLKISTESFSGSPEIKENVHVPKITIKPVTKTDADNVPKTPKKSSAICDNTEHIPVVTKLNIKPIMKPESVNDTEDLEDKVPVVSKLNIKPVVRPKDNEVESSVEDVPKVIKLNIKPIKNPEEKSSDKKDCDEMHADMDDSIPVVTKLNIKPIVKPAEDEGLKDSENQSSETGNSSDDNGDHIPVVTKLNIKPIVKPNESEGSPKPVSSNEQNIPVVTKLNIKPLVKPDESSTPSSPKKESLRSPGNSSIPVITKLNIKPIIRPDELNESKTNIDISERLPKNPPLVMKINIKNVSENNMDHEHLSNNIERTHSPKHSPKLSRSVTSDSNNSKSVTLNNIDSQKNASSNPASPSLLSTCDVPLENESNINSVPEEKSASSQDVHSSSKPSPNRKQVPEVTSDRLSESLEVNTNPVQINEVNETNNMEHSSQQISPSIIPMDVKQAASKQKKSIQNCTLLKKLLSSTKEEMEKSQSTNYSNCLLQCVKSGSPTTNCNDSRQSEKHDKNVEAENTISASYNELDIRKSPSQERSDLPSKHRSIEDVQRDANESVTKPLEISVTDKVTHQSSGQDSPRIILKINKTDHGPSAKIITEEFQKPSTSPTQIMNTYEAYDAHTPKKQIVNRIRKQNEESASLTIGKRLRSSRIMDTSDKSPGARRNAGKRPSMTESSSPATNKDSELSILDSKRLKLEQILSANKSLTITPVVVKNAQTSPGTENKQGAKTTNHTMVNNENCPKNGNSKLHNILTNLQAKQMHSLQMNDSSVPERAAVPSEADNSTTTSTASSDVVVEITRIDNCHPEVQEMIIQNADYRDLMAPENAARDPLDTSEAVPEEPPPPEVKPVEVTPLPRKRGRPRKLPVSEGAKLEVTPLPVPALEERPQRSLRLTRERPAILTRPRGRGRGRGARRLDPAAERSPARAASPRAASPEDPTSSRIKLPRMTEALDKSTGTFSTPLSHRRASAEPEEPEAGRGRARGRPARGRSPRARGRGRGGGRGATYMKETMGIYGRVCGPATTTVELFEEETCMMDDNATPSKPSHLLDEDSQSSVKSSTNDSHRMKKSKFADIFDSNKVWTAGDVKEYTWPPPDTPNMEPQVMMIQEQVAMFLGVKSFKRRYPELKRRTVVAEERDYVLSKGIVTEALCDLGITAVDASEVLDIMLSDYPHKYEEYRSHQRERQLAESSDEAVEPKIEEKPVKVEVKPEKPPEKPEPPKVDPEKARQEMAAAAAVSASEWNSRLSVWRRAACADLQSWSVQRPRAAPPARPRVVVAPPAGFYPLALLPGQYQHAYRHYTPDQLRYFPLNTVLSAPPAAPSPAESCSESEGEWGDHSSSSDHSDQPQHHAAKRKKLTKVKRSSQQEKDKDKEDSRGASTSAGDSEVVDTCRVCKLRLEANRKYTHERFLVCANCNAKLHPSCVDLGPDTIRKCREYAWQCAECKSCCGCRLPADDDKMLFCDLCDRGFHIYCVGLDQVPNGRWHCVECAICKSCGAREPGGLAGSAGSSSTPGTPGTTAEAEWHHQTRRGPGGHKVYSHSLCTPCARAYRIGRYCPLCERSFIGPKGTMQLVICKLCDRQLHQECVRRTVSALKVLDYTCARCRRGGITSRAAAVRLAPRTIATLFMAKRRFNKYAHRQYLQTRLAAAPDDDALD